MYVITESAVITKTVECIHHLTVLSEVPKNIIIPYVKLSMNTRYKKILDVEMNNALTFRFISLSHLFVMDHKAIIPFDLCQLHSASTT